MAHARMVEQLPRGGQCRDRAAGVDRGGLLGAGGGRYVAGPTAPTVPRGGSGWRGATAT